MRKLFWNKELMINFLVVHQILSMGSIVSIVVLYM